MSEKQILPIIKKTEKAFNLPIAEPEKKKVKRAKSPRIDTSEKGFAKQVDEILTGKR